MAAYSDADRARWVAEDPVTKQADRDDFARDRGRLIHSAALRRLAGKTQVVAPGSDDFVRNRLTHSLEVAQIGREFATVLGCAADVVDTACLAHDLGHPPFGHNGEQALNALVKDIGGFEGNAQTLRILTRLEAKRCHADGRPAGLNLTRASLDAATKYPWPRGQHPGGGLKFGVYEDDLPVFEFLRVGAPANRRCLEAQVMDWSDDVAYSVHDLEDGIAAGLIDPAALHAGAHESRILEHARTAYAPDLSPAALAAAHARLLDDGWIVSERDTSLVGLASLKDMTSRLIGRLLLVVEQATHEAYGQQPLIRYEADLVIPDVVRAECALLKAIAAVFVMQSEARAPIYAREQQILVDLVQAIHEDPEARLDPSIIGHLAEGASDDQVRRVVIDQVASLSDQRAVGLHQRWCGG